MWPNPHFPTDLLTFTKENLNEKLVCAVRIHLQVLFFFFK